MMPNKRNPDPAELVRGRAAETIAATGAILTILKGLPLAYQRDLQAATPPFLGAVAVLEASLGVLAGLVAELTVDRARLAEAAAEGYTTATAVADALVRRGLPFRTAHHVTGSIVAQAEEAGIALEEVPDAMIGMALGAAGDPRAAQVASDPAIGDELRAAASLEGALAMSDVIGGTSPRRVRAALAAARAGLEISRGSTR
jgi:argininosuccinate lyase